MWIFTDWIRRAKGAWSGKRRCDQNAQIKGPDWQAPPTDFTVLRLELGEPGPSIVVRTIIGPIPWYSDAPTDIPVHMAVVADRALAVQASPIPARRDGGCIITYRVPSRQLQ